MNRFIRFGIVILLAGLVYSLAHPFFTLVLYGMFLRGAPPNPFPFPWGVALAMGFAFMLGAITLVSPGPRIVKVLEGASIVSAIGFGTILAFAYVGEAIASV